jgi:hypothetical protein
MPLSASASSASISARVKGAPSAVPCTSTKPPAPVITTFMSVSQAASSTYSRSSSGVPSTTPTDTAATKSRTGEASMRPCCSSHDTASCAATKAPVMAAVRVPPSACSTSQSSRMCARPGRQVEHAAQRAADQALDLLRAAALLALGRLAVAARVGGARQHAVLGGHPALAAAALVRRHLLLHRGGAQHARVAEGHQHRAFGMAGVAALSVTGRSASAGRPAVRT